MLLAIVILFHWKLTLTHQYTWLENPDLANLVLPWMQFQAGEWHQHHFPLWDPNSWTGSLYSGRGSRARRSAELDVVSGAAEKRLAARFGS